MLRAIGLPVDVAKGTLRVTFRHGNIVHDAETIANTLVALMMKVMLNAELCCPLGSRALIGRRLMLLLSVGCALFECLPTVTESHALRADMPQAGRRAALPKPHAGRHRYPQRRDAVATTVYDE